MVHVPPELVISSTLCVGVVYKFSAPELIDTTIPHYFIVVAIDDNDNYLVLCTTQLNQKLNYFQRMGYDLNTLAYLTPTSENGLTDDTYVNCNDYHLVSKDALIDKVRSGMLSVTGNVSKTEYEQICKSINLSRVNDLPSYLLVYPED